MANITLPDGSVRHLPDGTTVRDFAAGIGPKLAKAAVVGKVDDQLVDLSRPLTGDRRVSIVTPADPEALEVLRHSTAHILAQAARRLYGADFQYTIGPVIENGFFYDFKFPDGVTLTADDLPKIEEEMKKVVAADLPFGREDVPCAEARQRLAGENQRFKDEIITELEGKGEQTVSLYKQGEFLDLCRGPHLPSTGRVPAFKLLSLAGAYWRGDSARDQLTRIYGTAFWSQKELDAHLARLEEAKARDHRHIGPALDLFHVQPEAPGCVFWHDKGWTLWRVVENYIRDVVRANGYIEVKTPQILSQELWVRSGHWEKYKDVMFVTESEKRTFAIKPMNCPGHIQIFNQRTKSYRDLPLRMAEFGACHRDEPGGTLHGIMRVRAFTQDDAHIFCTESQIQSEITHFVRMLFDVYKDFGFYDVNVALATRPAKRIGTDEHWDKTEKALADALQSINQPYKLNPGEGAFYGPKLEFQVADALGRAWQLGTIQVDPNLPQRLGSRYIAEDNTEQTPVMLHRAILGSLERFLGVLIEHYAGAFPLWLAPVQVSVLTISDKFAGYAAEVSARLAAAGLRADTSVRADTLNAKIRTAQLAKVPYMLVLGAKEQEAGAVTVRHRSGDNRGQMPVDAFVQMCREEIARKGRAADGAA